MAIQNYVRSKRKKKNCFRMNMNATLRDATRLIREQKCLKGRRSEIECRIESLLCRSDCQLLANCLPVQIQTS